MPATGPHPYVVLDVFTDTPLEGNPLAVFSDGDGLDGGLMARVARELNLSETVFVLAPQEDEHAAIRIFTPATELPFAGHPVLGTAFALALGNDASTIRLRTGAGLVPIRITRVGDQPVRGEMEQPLLAIEPFERAAELLAALGVERAELPIEIYVNGPGHVIVVLERARGGGLAPGSGALLALGPIGVSCVAGAGVNFKSRVFAPGLGVAEDPATGSAAGPVAAHLARHGVIAFGEEIELRQGVEIGRPSRLLARVEGTSERLEQVLVAGSAVLVARGEYHFA